MNVFWEGRTPENAVEESRYVREVSCREIALVFTGMGVEVVLIEFGGGVERLDAVFSVDGDDVDGGPVNRVFPVCPDLFYLLGFDDSDW